MSQTLPYPAALWPLAIYFALIIFTVAGMALTGFLTGERRLARQIFPYESGMPPTGNTQLRLGVAYYLVAMFFLIFDLEAAFVFAWAVSLRQGGWLAFYEMLLFVLILLAGLAYLWRQGALDWSPRPAAPTAGCQRPAGQRSGHDGA